METATLVASDLIQHCPGTNHYACSDGRWLLVTVVPTDVRMQFYQTASVFLSDELQNVLDADGDPANGMTALATPPGTTHAEVLAELGYQEIVTSVTAAPRDSLST